MSRSTIFQTPITTSIPAAGEDIATRAHQIWVQEGYPDGRDVEHWLKAEAQIRAERETPSKPGRLMERDTLMSGSRGGL